MWVTLLASLLCVAVPAVNADTVVETPLGTVTGSIDTSVDIPVEAFLGIPFAKPPINDRRFALPEAFGRFGDLDATRYQPICIQSVRPTTFNSSEDCLHLNIFRRQGVTAGAKAAVVVMIHGGAFAYGSTQEPIYSGVPLAAYGDIIVVTIHYRLGIFGFAATDRIPANIGFYDQKLAIEWIHEHIQHFGGDNHQVTLMGVSAGSMSISAHIMSPETRGKNLFQSVIMDAGVIYRVTVTTDETITRMKSIASKLGCATSGEEMLTCLRKADVDDLVNLSYDPQGYSPIVTFFPTSDGTYLPKDWTYDIQANADRYAKVRMLIGTARDEGATFVYHRVTRPDTDAEFVEWCAKLAFAFKYPLDFTSIGLAETLQKVYLTKYDDRLLALARFVGDASFYCPVNAFLDEYVKYQQRDIFVYQFNRVLRKSYFSLDPMKLGAFHGTPHVHFMGGLLTLKPSTDGEDHDYSIDSIAMVSKFVKGEVPVFRNVPWPDFKLTNTVMLFDNEPEIAVGLRHREECSAIFDHCDSGNKEPAHKSEL